ncbi:MAG TPA: DegQ family serine endoprotease [Dissulfurispiraceae bacterium]|nr:DegQ family serine endoprotease [Dissulfurispiraceae bacterium]
MMQYSVGKNSVAARTLALIVLVLAIFTVAPLSQGAEKTDLDDGEVLSKFGNAMATVAERVKPSIVNISTTRIVKTPRNPLFDDPFFRRFFGDGFQTPQKRKVTSLGSGVIATSDGFILTNNHVIDGAEDILVKLTDNREFKGKVVGTDARTDIAIIKIEQNNLPTIPWGDSDKLRVGEIVLAIGNPYGLSQTITMGIISALGRSGIGITDFEDFIQTDAAINPGNSGGALVNIRGELIGINTAIFSTSGGYQGIGFAIPSGMVHGIMDSITTQGKVVRGWLGVQIQPLTPELAKQFNLKDEQGVLLVDVVDEGPADKGGLRRGDVIVQYEGKKVESPFGLRNMVAATKPGKAVEVTVLRDGKAETVRVTIGELPAEAQASAPATTQTENNLKGVTVQDLTDEMLQKMGITRKIQGVVVTDVDEGSPAANRIAKGDVIIEINRKPVKNVKDYEALVSAIGKNQDILLWVMRNNAFLAIVITSQ